MRSSLHPDSPAPRPATLFVSPSERDQETLQKIFQHSNWHFRSAATCRDALALLRREAIPVVICNSSLPDGDWQSFLDSTERLSSMPKVIVSSRELNETLWADVLHRGGYDLLAIPFDSREVVKVVSLAWRSWDYARRTSDSAPLMSRPAAVGA